jgi:exosortase
MDIAKETPQVERQSVRPLAWLPFVLLAVLTVLLYMRALRWWWQEWTAPGSYYAHGIFIPFFVGVMVWRDRERLRRLPIGHAWWGVLPLLLAIAIVLFAERVGSRVTLSLSFILFLIGLSLVLAGTKITRALLFPMVFMFTMIPLLPDTVINVLAFPIQMASATMAAKFLNLISFATVQNGTTLNLEHYTMAVELPCSGFKTLVGLTSFAAAFAYVIEGALWKRWALFLCAAPLAVLVNGVRVILIGIVGELWGTHAAATFHDYSGFIVLILGFMVLFNLARWLRCERFLGIDLRDAPKERGEIENRKSKIENPIGPTPNASDMAALDARYGPPRADTLRRLYAGVFPLAGLLAAGCVAKAFVHMPAPPNPKTWLSQAEVKTLLDGGAWKMTNERPIDPDVQQELKPLIWIDRDYVETGAHSGLIHLLINGGKERGTFHDPHDCFPASGYDLRDTGAETIQTPAGPVMVQVSEATNKQDRQTTLLMYLFVMDGRQYQTTRSFKWALTLRSLLGDDEKPSYFIRFRQWNPGSGEDRKEELRRFIRAVWRCIGRKVMEGKAEEQTASR